MDWIRVASDLRDHPKARKLGAILHAERAHSFVLDLWGWAAKFYPSGDLSECDALDIALGCGWSGDPVEFVDALVSCRWLDQEGDLLLIHDWEEYQGKVIEQKRAACERARAWRERMKHEREANAHRMRTPRARTLLRTNERTNDTDVKTETGAAAPPASPEPKARGFTAPTTEEVQALLDSLGETRFTGEHFCATYQRQGWKLSNGQRMTDWHAAITTWRTMRDRDNGGRSQARQAAVHAGSSDPTRRQVLEMQERLKSGPVDNSPAKGGQP